MEKRSKERWREKRSRDRKKGVDKKMN